jgi:hypothetical protein
MANRRDIQFTYTPHNKATILDCNFTVDSTNADGISGLETSARIASVYMHTSTTPSAGNPNPDAGFILINLQDNYNTFLGMNSARVVPLTGSELTTGLTVGTAYVITTVGASTRAQWTTAGLPVHITPAIGVSFLAAATSIAGGGKAKAVLSSAIYSIEIVGDPNLMNSNGAHSAGAGRGMQLILKALGPTATADTALVETAPADGSKIFLSFYLNNSAFGV